MSRGKRTNDTTKHGKVRTFNPSRLSASTNKRTHGAHYAAVVAIKDALHAARYRCTGEANGTLEAYVGGGVVPVILVQTYNDDDGVEVWMPVTQSIKTADTVLALQVATAPTLAQQAADDAVTHQHASRAEERICEALAEEQAHEHPDTDEHRAGCTHCQYVHDSKQPDDGNALGADDTAIVLAALRLFQRTYENCPSMIAAQWPEHFADVAPGSAVRSVERVDVLCRAINTSGLKYHRLLHLSDFRCSQCNFTAYAMVEMSAHWTASGHAGCAADIKPAQAQESKTWTPERTARAFELLKVIADFWGADQCDAPIHPGAYLTEEDEAIRFVIRDFVYPAPQPEAEPDMERDRR